MAVLILVVGSSRKSGSLSISLIFFVPFLLSPKLGSSSSQKPAQQHFSSPQAAAHVIFKGWTAAPSLSLCAGQQQLKDQDSMGSKAHVHTSSSS